MCSLPLSKVKNGPKNHGPILGGGGGRALPRLDDLLMEDLNPIAPQEL